ncbi:transposase [Nocardia brasiliensis]|uniref:Transposase n=1 Tax=Nocardia brasiliensis TaxID=37326 RepID=A0A6G9XZ70_NOCBR|nr:transposase [Nocardia brasiliensis]
MRHPLSTSGSGEGLECPLPGIVYIPPGTPWNNGFIESFNHRLRSECLNRNHWTSLSRPGS